MSHLDLISDRSKEKLVAIPSSILEMTNLKMLFLEGNFITALPDDIFWKLPRLMWLDLRNNLLETIPVSIAFHEKLENLLLTNNNLQKLPNELGTVQNLKALQVSDNPLIYPTRQIIVAGTKAIKNFLKTQYEKGLNQNIHESETDISITDEDIQDREEIVKITDKESEESVKQSTSPSKTNTRETSKSARNQKIKKKISDDQTSNPDLKVKQLLSAEGIKNKKNPQKAKIIHKVSRTGSKLFLKSYLNKTLSDGDGRKFNNLKEGWLNELRILLTDQERILQQERNLRAISNWRLKNKDEKTFHEGLPQPPYGTDQRYAKMLSREDLAKQFNEFKEKGYISSGPTKYSPINVQKMITNLMEQLKDMQVSYDPLSSESGTEQAEIQIKTIMDIQKKLVNLKSINEKTL